MYIFKFKFYSDRFFILRLFFCFLWRSVYKLLQEKIRNKRYWTFFTWSRRRFVIFLAVIFNTAIFDSFAYVIGSNFGKNKIAINISPNKTYEGLVGGLIVSVLYSYSLCIFLNLDFIVIIFLFLGCFFAFFGDLFISYYKRKSGIKDTGHFLPGHGGILDRLDSHLIATPLILLLFSIVL